MQKTHVQVIVNAFPGVWMPEKAGRVRNGWMGIKECVMGGREWVEGLENTFVPDPRTFLSVQLKVLVCSDRETKTGYRRELGRLFKTYIELCGNNTGNPAEPMSYNNAYKKVKNYLHVSGTSAACHGNALLIVLGPGTAWAPLLQSQNWSGNLIATGQWKHEYPFDTSTTFRAERQSLEWWRPLNDTTMLESVLLRAQTRSWSNRLLLLRFSLSLWTICRMKSHEPELLSTESRLASVLWKTRGKRLNTHNFLCSKYICSHKIRE